MKEKLGVFKNKSLNKREGCKGYSRGERKTFW